MPRFAVIGLDHNHAFDHVKGLLAAGCEFAGYCPQSSLPSLLSRFSDAWPAVPQINRNALIDDPSIDIICISAIPCERADIAISAMRAGKDVMVDKPGVTTTEQLRDVRRVVAETGRIFSVCFSERHGVRSAVRAGQLVQQGAIGRVIQTTGLGPHKLQLANRPEWFFERENYGGILVDIASHRFDRR